MLFKKDKPAGSASGGWFIKIFLAQAAAEHATKIVFGEPSEAGCARVTAPPRAPETPCAWEQEDRDRFRGVSEADLPDTEDEIEKLMSFDPSLRHPSKRKPCNVPLWFKIGDTYHETIFSPPAFVFLDVLSLMRGWDQCEMGWDVKDSEWKKSGYVKINFGDEAILSGFVLKFEDGLVIRASFGFEPGFQFSISIHEVGKV